MFNLQTKNASGDKTEIYLELNEQFPLLIGDEKDFIANAANFAALYFHGLPDLNWAGFYLVKKGELVVAPFQGKPACTRIKIGQGVCGTAAERRETIIVPNVHEFSGHIACDTASNSEIVIPLIRNDELLGVFDLDSPSFNRFDQTDKEFLERAAQILMDKSDFDD